MATPPAYSRPAAPPVLMPKQGPAPTFPLHDGISIASHRLRDLAELSGSLTDSLNPEDAVSAVEAQALAALGASGAIVLTLGDLPAQGLVAAANYSANSNVLSVVHATGMPADLCAALTELPLSAATPLAEVARSGAPTFLHSEEELLEYPDWGRSMLQAGFAAGAIVPVWANGELRGVLGLSWRAPHAFDEDERAFVLTLGVICAQAIIGARIRTAERDARVRAEAASQSKSNLLSTISHDLRTPLNAILDYVAILENEIDGPISAMQRQHLGKVRTSGGHVLELINELLHHARLQAGRESVHAEPVQLAEVVERSLVLLRPAAEMKGVRIIVEKTGQRTALHTDHLKLSQILINLLGNAVKYTDSGRITLRFASDNSNGVEYLRIEVTDTGRGIADADHERVFEAFWQRDSDSRGTFGGAGLGLPVARQLARLLGGDVLISRSAIGSGSTFIASIPVTYVPRAATPGQANAATAPW